ncbi:trypsin-like peptidase domain-containing protein [Streptomyces sp. NPDC005566]|uniref:trypsin-like serine peptidase n=1 Tax=Streptomyces sp. NPDC005566 TaxID=3156886 RepID=UPI00339E81B1
MTHRGDDLEPLTIWQPDDRRAYNDPGSSPWGLVCLIANANGGFGSGTIVGPRHVLTASHVVAWNTTAAERIDVHQAGTTQSATTFATRALAFTQILGDPTVTTLDEDYAVLVTRERIGDRFGWLGTRTYDSSWDGDNIWDTMGYAGDVASGVFPVFQQRKNMDEDEWDLGSGRAMTTSADVMPRQSGSPMFAKWAEGNFVVSVVSAVGSVWASGLENWCSGGNDLTRLVKIARAENP